MRRPEEKLREEEVVRSLDVFAMGTEDIHHHSLHDRLGRTPLCPAFEERGSQHTIECRTRVGMIRSKEEKRELQVQDLGVTNRRAGSLKTGHAGSQIASSSLDMLDGTDGHGGCAVSNDSK